MKSHQIAMFIVATIATFFAIVAFNNVTDFDTNWIWVRDLLLMQNIESDGVKYRAISPSIALPIYCSIIFWEALTSIVCFAGFVKMVRAKSNPQRWIGARRTAGLGLMMGFLLFMVAFVIVANEWFYLWQTKLGGLTTKSLAYAILLLVAILFINGCQIDDDA